MQESNSNQSQDNTKKYTREIAAKQYKVQEYGHPTRKLEKNKGILPSNKSIDPKKKNKGIMPSKLIDRKDQGFMPSKIGPPIIRWKEKKKKQKHHYLLYQTKHHSHQLIIIILIPCHHTMTLSINRITNTVNSQELIFTCSTQYVSIVITCSTLYNNLM